MLREKNVMVFDQVPLVKHLKVYNFIQNLTSNIILKLTKLCVEN